MRLIVSEYPLVRSRWFDFVSFGLFTSSFYLASISHAFDLKTAVGDSPFSVERQDLSELCKDPEVKTLISRSYQENTSNTERRMILDARRVRLHEDLVKRQLERSIEVLGYLTPYLSLNESGSKVTGKLPVSCDRVKVLDGEWWSDLQNESFKVSGLEKSLRNNRDLIWFGNKALPNSGLYHKLLFASFELALWRYIEEGRWQDGRPEGVSKVDWKLFRPNSTNKQVTVPQMRSHEIIDEYPILTQRIRSKGQVFGKASVADTLFLQNFGSPADWQKSAESKVNSKITADLKVFIFRQYVKLLSGSRDEVIAVAADLGINSEKLLEEKTLKELAYFTSWVMFLRYNVLSYIGDTVAASFAKGVNKDSLELLKSTAVAWEHDIFKIQQKTCSSSNDWVHAEPRLFALHAFESEDDEVIEHLDAFCNAKWLLTPQKRLQHTLEPISYGAAIASVLVGGKLFLPQNGLKITKSIQNVEFYQRGLVLGGTSGVLASIGLISEAYGNEESLLLSSALYQAPLKEFNRERLETIYKSGMSVVQPALTGYFVGKSIAKGWRVFIPDFSAWGNPQKVMFGLGVGIPVSIGTMSSVKTFIENGQNPVKSVPFWVDIVATFFLYSMAASDGPNLAKNVANKITTGTLPMAKLVGSLVENAPGTIESVIGFLVIDDAMQKIFSLQEGVMPNDRVRGFVLNWIPFMSGNVLVNSMHGAILPVYNEGSLVGKNLGLSLLWRLTQLSLYYSASYKTYLRYLEGDDFWDAVKESVADTVVRHQFWFMPATKSDADGAGTEKEETLIRPTDANELVELLKYVDEHFANGALERQLKKSMEAKESIEMNDYEEEAS